MANVEQEVCFSYKITGQRLVELFDKYSANKEIYKRQEIINALTNLRSENNDDLKIKLPNGLTPEIYLKIYKRLYAGIRYLYYKKSVESGNMIAKEELEKSNEISPKNEELLSQIFKLYSVEISKNDSYSHIMKICSYVYMCDSDFEAQYEIQKSNDEKLAVALIRNIKLTSIELNPITLSESDFNVFFQHFVY